MDIHFKDIQYANAPADKLFEVITDYSSYPRFNPAVESVDVVAKNERGAEFFVIRNTSVGKHVHAFDRYERNGDFTIKRTYGSRSTGRSIWTIHGVDAGRSALTIEATTTMPAWKGVVMRPILKRVFFRINFTPFLREAERRAQAGNDRADQGRHAQWK